MIYSGYFFADLGVRLRVGSFCPVSGTAEHRVFLCPDVQTVCFEDQLHCVCVALDRLRSLSGFSGTEVAFKRYYLKDIASQLPFIQSVDPGVFSAVQQPMLYGGSLAVLVYLVTGTSVRVDEDGLSVSSRNGYTHIYASSLTSVASGTEAQTTEVLHRFTQSLARFGCVLRDHCVRTWIYVRNIDVHYAAMVKARSAFFECQGLSVDSHFIASTGIEGSYASPEVFVGMDAYAVAGLFLGQMGFLSAPEYLNNPKEYGVTFERGTTIDYGDRRHLYISGTASIDAQGNILFPGDVLRQTVRMLENIKALLEAGQASVEDVAYWLVYLREASDFREVDAYFEDHFPLVPRLILLAPVCRPGWLVETECVAVTAGDHPPFRPF